MKCLEHLQSLHCSRTRVAGAFFWYEAVKQRGDVTQECINSTWNGFAEQRIEFGILFFDGIEIREYDER